MKRFITLPLLLGVAIGGLAGYAYWYFIGCSTGSCMITGNWYTSTAYGILMGGLASGLKNDK